jgi:hypothetical protein
MSVDSIHCCYCVTGYGVLVEVDAGKIARALGERPHRSCRTLTLKHGRFTAAMRRILTALAGGLAAGGGGTA